MAFFLFHVVQFWKSIRVGIIREVAICARRRVPNGAPSATLTAGESILQYGSLDALEGAMSQFTVGQQVKIPCEVQRGAFPTELLVTFETVDGPISGFVRSEDVQRVGGHRGLVLAIIKEISSDTITVIVKGSFFTTTGLAYLKRDWADSNVQPAYA